MEATVSVCLDSVVGADQHTSVRGNKHRHAVSELGSAVRRQGSNLEVSQWVLNTRYVGNDECGYTQLQCQRSKKGRLWCGLRRPKTLAHVLK